MTARQVIAPTTYGVTVEQAKAQSRVLSSADDDLVGLYLAAALAHVEKSVGMAIEPQTWELVLDAFPAEAVMLPGPLVSVTEVTYVDENGVTQTVDPTSYEVDDVSLPDGWIIPSAGWPSPMGTINAVRVTYVVGRGSMPADIRQAVIMLAAHFYNQREAASEKALKEVPFGVETILSRHRLTYV